PTSSSFFCAVTTRSQPLASSSLRIFLTRFSISARFSSSNPITLTRMSWRPRINSATSGSLFSTRRATIEITLLLMWTSTNSPPEAGGENFPKSTYPADGLSAQTPVARQHSMTGQTEGAPACDIVRFIHSLRDRRVILDGDLASIYGVQTRVLNQAVKRNQTRFPADFMFELTRDEILGISQTVT